MQVIYARCAGLDVHKKAVSACVSVCEADRNKRQQTRTFGTFTGALLEPADWLKEHGVKQVAMEATGVYWRPVWAVLEGQFEQMLVNPQHIKAVPGRKTDTKDCEWIADLLQHGLLKGSFVPPTPIQDLRDLTRYRGFDAPQAVAIGQLGERHGQKLLPAGQSTQARVAAIPLHATAKLTVGQKRNQLQKDGAPLVHPPSSTHVRAATQTQPRFSNRGENNSALNPCRIISCKSPASSLAGQQ
jgi:transposase